MRTLVLALLGGFWAASLGTAQEPTGWAAKLFKTEDGKIPSGHNFGTVPKGAVLNHRFSMTNIYAVPLQITTSVSCGCVSATANPQVLQPKETGTLDVSIDATKFVGQKTVTLYITAMNPQFWSTSTMTINAFCRGDVMLDPGTATFGIVPRGQSSARELIVRYYGVQPWQITGVAPSETAPFDVRFQEAYRQPGQVGYKVQMMLKSDAPPGSHKGDLQLTTNDPNNSIVPIPYDVTVQASLAVLPEVSRFGSVSIGEPAARKILIRGNRPFRILSVEGQGDGLTAEIPTAATPVQSLTIRLQPTQAGAIQRTLVIKTDLDGGQAVTARVEANVAQ